MSATPEQLIARALRGATDQIALPAESRWIPTRRASASAMHPTVAVAGAILIVAAGLGINSFREARLVPATQPNAFQAADDAEWSRIRAELPADALVLRPTWIPAEFGEVGTSECPTPMGAAFAANGRYDFDYYKGKRIHVRNPRAGAAPACARIEIRTDAYTVSPQLTEVGVLNERRTTVQVRTGPRVFDIDDQPHQLIYLNWTEDGAQVELSSLDVELADLLRVLRSLEPMK